MTQRWCFAVLSLLSACGAAPTPVSGPGQDGGTAPVPSQGDAAAAPRCGDRTCNGTENCETCPGDCGACPACGAAPSCTDAVGLPYQPALRADLCQGAHENSSLPDGKPPYTANCGPAKLRLRLASLEATKGSGKAYCIVHATDGTTSAVAITPKTKDLDDKETFFFSPGVGMFWGNKELQRTTNNLTITYNCFHVKSDAWSKVLSTLGDSANKNGGVAGDYGWAFAAGGASADVAAAAVQAASGDDLKLNAQQVISKADLLDLTNGRKWTLQQEGGTHWYSLYHWNWRVTVEAWGCADAIYAPN